MQDEGHKYRQRFGLDEALRSAGVAVADSLDSAYGVVIQSSAEAGNFADILPNTLYLFGCCGPDKPDKGCGGQYGFDSLQRLIDRIQRISTCLERIRYLLY